MKAPLLPRSDAPDLSGALEQGASNEGQFASAGSTPPAPANGWDPYEVWRTRIFAAQPTSYNRSRGGDT